MRQQIGNANNVGNCYSEYFLISFTPSRIILREEYDSEWGSGERTYEIPFNTPPIRLQTPLQRIVPLGGVNIKLLSTEQAKQYIQSSELKALSSVMKHGITILGLQSQSCEDTGFQILLVLPTLVIQVIF